MNLIFKKKNNCQTNGEVEYKILARNTLTEVGIWYRGVSQQGSGRNTPIVYIREKQNISYLK